MSVQERRSEKAQAGQKESRTSMVTVFETASPQTEDLERVQTT